VKNTNRRSNECPVTIVVMAVYHRCPACRVQTAAFQIFRGEAVWGWKSMAASRESSQKLDSFRYPTSSFNSDFVHTHLDYTAPVCGGQFILSRNMNDKEDCKPGCRGSHVACRLCSVHPSVYSSHDDAEYFSNYE